MKRAFFNEDLFVFLLSEFISGFFILRRRIMEKGNYIPKEKITDVFDFDAGSFRNKDSEQEYRRSLRRFVQERAHGFMEKVIPLLDNRRHGDLFGLFRRHPFHHFFWDEITHFYSLSFSTDVVWGKTYGEDIDEKGIREKIAWIKGYIPSADKGKNYGGYSWILERVSAIENRLGSDRSEPMSKCFRKGELIEIPDPELRKMIRGLCRDLYRAPVRSILLGSYHWQKNSIVLYVKSIYDAAKKNNISTDQLLLSVLCHEVFHMLHYSLLWLMRKNIPEDYEWTVVAESLATYEEYVFAKETFADKELCRYLRDSWDLSDLSHWPYAGAGMINRVMHGPDSPKDAFDELDGRTIVNSLYDHRGIYEKINALNMVEEAFG